MQNVTTVVLFMVVTINNVACSKWKPWARRARPMQEESYKTTYLIKTQFD